MRRILLLCTVMLFTVSFTRAQDADLPLCSAGQWEKMEEILPRFDEMDELLESIETGADLLAFIESALTLRSDLWSAPPLCQPYIEFATIAGGTINDNVILNAMYLFHPDDSDTKRLLGGEAWSANELAHLFGLGAKSVASLLGLGPWHANEDDGAFPAACSYVQKQRVIREKRQTYVEILRGALSVDTVEDLLQYDDEQLAFRETAYVDLPLCAEAFEIAQRMRHTSADFVAAHALAFSGVRPDVNPSLQQILDSVELLPAWIIPIEFRDAGRVRRLFDNNLPACTEAQLADVAGISHPRFGPAGEFDESVITEATRQQLLAYATIDVAWRAENLPRFPKCAEAYEIALLLSQTGTDIVAAVAITVAGVPRAQNLYHDQALRGVEALQLSLAQLPETTAVGAAAETITSPLPACTMVQLYIMEDMVMAPYGTLAEVIRDIEVKEDFRHYAEGKFAWRAKHLRYLPACSGALDLAYALNSNADNIAAYFTLSLHAQISSDADPYYREIGAFLDLYDGVLADIVARAPQ